MNIKKLISVLFALLLFAGAVNAQTYYYVNSTDGDDSYTGLSATNNPPGSGPKRTLEAAYATFPDGALVYVAAGEYYKDQSAIGGGNDNNGVNFTGTKSMTFIIQTYNGSNVLYLDGTAAGAFVVDVTAAKTIKFKADTGVQSVSITTGPIVTGLGLGAATNAINLLSGTFDVSELASFNVGNSVTAMTRTNGSLTGSFVYTALARTMTYNGVGNFTAGGELQAALLGGTLTVNLAAPSTLTVPSSISLSATTGGTIQNTGTGAVTFNGTITIAGGAGAPSTIRNTVAGTMTLNGAVTISSTVEAWGTYIENVNAAGVMAINGLLSINHGGTTASDLDNTGGFNPGPVASNLIQNTAGGTLSISGGIASGVYTVAGPTNYYAYVVIKNNAAGTINIGNAAGTASTIYGLIQNDAGGIVNLTGNVTVRANGANLPYTALSNVNAASQVKINANTLTLTFMGAVNILNNTGSISSAAAGLLDFTNAAAGTVAGAGSLPNIRTNAGDVTAANATPVNGNVTIHGGGDLTLTAATAINGNILADGVSGNAVFTAATTVTGDVTLASTGNITFNAAALTTISKNVFITGTGTFTTNPAPGAMNINQTVQITDGTFKTGGATTTVTVYGNFTQNSGAIVFTAAGDVIDLKANFYRTTGAVTPTAGTLRFSSQTNQTFKGGPNLLLFNLVTTGLNTVVSLVDGSVEINNSVTINPNSRIDLGTQNIRMVGAGSTITNYGKVLANTGLGAVIFEGPDAGGLGVGATANTIGGNGEYSNIEIRLVDPVDFVTVAAPDAISFSGRLTFTRGGIDNAANDFNPYGTSFPQIWVNLADQNSDIIVDGKPFGAGPGLDPFNTTANFNTTNVAYDLTYYNPINLLVAGGPVLIGNEFKDGYVRNLTTTSTGTLATDIIDLTAARAFTGALTVGTGATLNLNGFDLTATGLDQAHVVNGTVTSTAATDMFIVTGSGTITGSGAGLRNIDVLNFNAANAANALTVTGLKTLGKNLAGYGLINTLGTLTLTMPDLGVAPVVDPGNVFLIKVDGGKVVLGAHAEVPTTVGGGNNAVDVAAGAAFDFANYNLWFSGTDDFNSAATATFSATGATTGKGYLLVQNNMTLQTNGALVPRIDLAAGFTITLASNAGVSDIFTNTGAGSTVTGAFTFEHAGNVWNATNNTYTGLTMKITGPVTTNMYNHVTVPVLTLDNAANTMTLADLWTGVGSGVPALKVNGLFTFTTGNIAMGVCDIEMIAAGPSLTYTAGTFAATTATGVTATDDQNGELVFNNAAPQTFTVGATQPTFINVRFANNAVNATTANPWTVSKRFVIGANNVKVTSGTQTTGILTLGDGLWYEVRGIGLLKNNTPANLKPTFAGVVDVYYQAGAVVTGGELPTTATDPTALRDLFVNTGVAQSANITVNRSLNLIAGAWDPEPGATIYDITMAANSSVIVTDGTITNAPVVNTFMLKGGPVTLTYQNTVGNYTITAKEFPTTAGFVTVFNANPAAARTLFFPASGARTVGDFVMNAGNATTSIFDLNGGTLTVSNTSSSTLTKGTLLSSATDIAGEYIYGTLTNAGSLTSTANTTITNVNVTTNTATLAGVFNSVDLDAGGGNFLPAVAPLMTVNTDASVAGFAGNLTVTGNTTVNGVYSDGTLTAKGNVTVVAPGSFGANSNLVFNGAANQDFTVPAAGVTVHQLTLDQTTTSTITLKTGDLGFNTATNPNNVVTPYIVFKNGVLVTSGTTKVVLPTKRFGFGMGFTRTDVTGTNVSHILGKVRRTTFNQGDLIANSGEERTEFPVGNATTYRQAAITFNPKDGKPTIPNITFDVEYKEGTPGGQTALPIVNGVKADVDIARYPSFYWYINTTPNSISPSLRFDLELGATGFTQFGTNAYDARIIRRHGAINDVNNPWLLQGLEAGVDIVNSYDNEYNAPSKFAVVNRNSLAGLRADGAVFTLGLSTNLATDVVPTNVTASVATIRGVLSPANYVNYVLNLESTGGKMFKNNVGALRYEVASSNAAIATASVAGAVLTVVPVAVGTANITVTAFDDDNNDFMSYTFPVNVGVVGNDKQESAIPTEFAMSQNYPNPFNPTTAIKFALPKESHVTIKVINMIGQEVASLVDEVRPAGYHVINFNANGLASGNYIAIIKASEFTKTIKMSLLK